MMRALLLAAVLASGALASDEFDAFLLEYEKSYDDAAERGAREAIFNATLELVRSENGKGHAYSLGITAHADLTAEEFLARGHGFDGALSPPDDAPLFAGTAKPPAAVDWRESGAVTAIKNQGTCGACWLFSATGAMEGINAITTKKLVNASEQEIGDCDYANFTDVSECMGGVPWDAFNWVIHNKGDNTEAAYPYTANYLPCRNATARKHALSITGWARVPADDEAALTAAVAVQPISVGIDATSVAIFQHYKSGVIDSKDCGTAIDHGVLVVGYGEEKGKLYWLVKNSWGTAWGEDGYFKLLRGAGGEGQCGVAHSATYPVIKAE